MGKVRVTVKISNAADLVNARRGLITPEQVRSLEADAVVDTGAVRSCIPVDLQRKLGLGTERRINAEMANGKIENVEMTEPAYLDIMDRLATESLLVLGSEVLIGQMALASTDLLVDCTRGRVIANPAHPNSVVMKIR